MSRRIDRRHALVGGAPIATAALADAAAPRRVAPALGRQGLAALVPPQVGARQAYPDSDVVPDTVDGVSDAGQTVALRYRGAGSRAIMLVMSYHGSRSPDLKVHRPETCYKVAGFDLGPVQPITIRLDANATLAAVSFRAVRADRVENVLYWTRVGSVFPQTLMNQRLAFIGQALHGVRADGLLARFSVVDSEAERGGADLPDFARAFLAATSLTGRRLFIGGSSELFS